MDIVPSLSDAPALMARLFPVIKPAPFAGLVIDAVGGWLSVKLTPLLFSPLTLTTTDPVELRFGTGAVMLVARQLEGVAVIPLNLTLLPSWVAPKSVPVIMIGGPAVAVVGEILLIAGGGCIGTATVES